MRTSSDFEGVSGKEGRPVEWSWCVCESEQRC